jgi:hypothetical protein
MIGRPRKLQRLKQYIFTFFGGGISEEKRAIKRRSRPKKNKKKKTGSSDITSAQYKNANANAMPVEAVERGGGAFIEVCT